MDLIDLDRRALASTAELLDRTRPEQLALPTPCEGWDVRTLLGHVIGGNHLYATAAAGGAADWATRDEADWCADDPAAAYHRSAAAVTAAFAPLDLDRGTVVLPFGALPARFAVAVHFVDVLAHGWDLATATGQDPTLDPALATAAIEIAESYPDDAWGPDRFFADKVEVATDAPPHTRLAALLGRTP